MGAVAGHRIYKLLPFKFVTFELEENEHVDENDQNVENEKANDTDKRTSKHIETDKKSYIDKL